MWRTRNHPDVPRRLRTVQSDFRRTTVSALTLPHRGYVSLSIDHRVIDGAQTNAWLSRFVQVLREWPASA